MDPKVLMNETNTHGYSKINKSKKGTKSSKAPVNNFHGHYSKNNQYVNNTSYGHHGAYNYPSWTVFDEQVPQRKGSYNQNPGKSTSANYNAKYNMKSSGYNYSSNYEQAGWSTQTGTGSESDANVNTELAGFKIAQGGKVIHNEAQGEIFGQDQAENIKIVLKTALNHFPYEIDISTFLDLKPVQEIAKIDKDLYDLFVVAVEGNLTSFEQWKQSRAAYLTSNKIDEERVLDRVRLKSIFQEVQKNKVLKLKEIEKLLKLSEDEVEFWIIKVHQEGHIRGKIDQLEGTLYIDGIIDDSFKSSEWKDLETNLEVFRKNYEGYIEKLRSERSK